MNLIDKRIKELEDIPEFESHPIQSYQLVILKSLQTQYDDCADLTNILKSLHEVYDIIYEQRHIYLTEEREA